MAASNALGGCQVSGNPGGAGHRVPNGVGCPLALGQKMRRSRDELGQPELRIVGLPNGRRGRPTPRTADTAGEEHHGQYKEAHRLTYGPRKPQGPSTA